MSQAATKDDFQNLGSEVRSDMKVLGDNLRGEIKTLGNTLRDEIKENTREIISHFNKSQGFQNTELRAIRINVSELKDDMAKVKLAVVDIMATDRHMHNLVGVLKREGISFNDNETLRS